MYRYIRAEAEPQQYRVVTSFQEKPTMFKNLDDATSYLYNVERRGGQGNVQFFSDYENKWVDADSTRYRNY